MKVCAFSSNRFVVFKVVSDESFVQILAIPFDTHSLDITVVQYSIHFLLLIARIVYIFFFSKMKYFASFQDLLHRRTENQQANTKLQPYLISKRAVTGHSTLLIGD